VKIVVTGALGHIGSRLIRSLPDMFPEAKIVMIDNLATNRYSSLFDLPARGNYRFIEADIVDANLVKIFDGVDVVIHLAAITNAPESFKNEELVYRVNLDGTRLVAEACAQVGSPLIFPSTTSVYGTQLEVVDENCSEAYLKPQSPYAETKLKAEKLLFELEAQKGLRFIVCRFGTIFGISPGMRFHTAINKFCWQAVLGQPITVWRTALHQRRPYLDLGDAIRSVQWIIQKRLYTQSVYNVLTVNVMVQDILDIVAKYVAKIKIQFVDTAIMNQLSYTVANDLFRKSGFEFEGNLEKGIQDTIQLIKNAEDPSMKE
jgi:UDP-glucose 4-epimerase